MEYRPNPNGPMRLYGPNSAFRLRYEFVDTTLGGTPLDPTSVLLHTKAGSGGNRIGGHVPEPAALVQSHSTSCNRVYKSTLTSRGVFRSPSNVFFYGRGGSENISCTIRFEARLGESVRYYYSYYYYCLLGDYTLWVGGCLSVCQWGCQVKKVHSSVGWLEWMEGVLPVAAALPEISDPRGLKFYYINKTAQSPNES